MAEGNGSGFELHAGPAQLKATGGIVINVLLAVSLLASSAFVVYYTTQQTILIQAEHAAHLVALRQDHVTISQTLAELTRANENVFLSTMLPDNRKKDLPTYIQDRAREMVEKRAEGITQDRSR